LFAIRTRFPDLTDEKIESSPAAPEIPATTMAASGWAAVVFNPTAPLQYAVWAHASSGSEEKPASTSDAAAATDGENSLINDAKASA
jgi:hypothetical protein